MAGPESRRFAKYRFIAELGQGGMAEVFLALSSGPAGFNKLVVVKQIRENLAEDPDFLAMFLDEARLAARLNHPNVVQTNEVGQDGKRYFIAMEYLEGQPLSRLVHRLAKEGKGMPLGLHVRVLIDALTGLHHAHNLTDFDGTPLHVVHRDATPHNIFVTYDGSVKVVDFGIAKALGASTETRAGVVKGKVAYMSPEQARGDAIDRRSDVFAAGMMLWEALAERRPFRGQVDMVIMNRILAGDIPSPRTVKPDIPAELDAICMKALSHDREGRYATAQEMARALEHALDALGERAETRALGELMTTTFEVERAQIRSLVEAEIAAMRAETDPVPPSLRKLTLPRLNAPPMESGPVSTRPPPDVDVSQTPLPGSTRPPSQRSVRPPPIILDAAPISTTEPAPLTPAPLSPSPLTPSPLSPSTLAPNTAAPTPPTPAAGSRRRAMLAAIGIGVGAAAATVVLAWPSSKPPAQAPTDAAATARVTTHTIHIESTPPGATVSEGGSVLGTTPMAIPLDPSQTGARTLVIALDGFVPYTISQGPTREDVRLLVPLAPAPAAAPATATPPAATSAAAAPDATSKAPAATTTTKAQAPKQGAPATTGATTTTKPPEKNPLDIRMTR